MKPIATDNRIYGLRWSAFPRSLRDELAVYLSRRADPDALLKWSYSPLNPNSLARFQLIVKEYAAALVHQGVPVKSLDGLEKLATSENLKLAVKYVLARSGVERSSMASNMASAARCIGRHWTNATDVELKAMGDLRRLVEPRGRPAQRSTARLRPAADRRKIRSLLRLPHRMMREARDGAERGRKIAVSAAVTAQTALAIELLIMCPMRPWSLRNIRIDRHLHEEMSPEGMRYHLEPPNLASQRVGGLRYELSPETAGILCEYLSRHHKHLTTPPSPYLFVGWQGNKPRTYGGFHKAITDAIFSRLGLEMCPFDLRFLAGALHLRHHPGRIELVSRLLGHRSTQHTMKLYADVMTVPLMAKYQRMVVTARSS